MNRFVMAVPVLIFVFGMTCSCDNNEVVKAKEAIVTSGTEDVPSDSQDGSSLQTGLDLQDDVNMVQERNVTEDGRHAMNNPSSITIDSEWTELDDKERFNKLKDLITENLPYMEAQLQDAFKSPVKLKMVVESRPESQISKESLEDKLKGVEVQLEKMYPNGPEEEE